MNISSTITLIENHQHQLNTTEIGCHWDGDFEWVGSLLITAYNDPTRLKQLLRRGSISGLGLYPSASPFIQQISAGAWQPLMGQHEVLMDIRDWHWHTDVNAQTFDEVCDRLAIKIPDQWQPLYQRAWQAGGFAALQDLEQLFTVASADCGQPLPPITGQFPDTATATPRDLLKQVLAASPDGKRENNYVYLTGFADPAINDQWFMLHSVSGQPDQFLSLSAARQQSTDAGPELRHLARQLVAFV